MSDETGSDPCATRVLHDEDVPSHAASGRVGSFVTDGTGRLLHASATAHDICCLARGENLAAAWRRLARPEERDRIIDGWLASTREGLEYSSEFRLHCQGEEARWVRVRASPLATGGDGSNGYAGTVEDITRERAAVEALRRSEGKYRMLMEQASDGIHTYDLEGNFIDVNTSLCRMLGYTRQELLRMRVADLVVGTSSASVACAARTERWCRSRSVAPSCATGCCKPSYGTSPGASMRNRS